MGVRSSFDAPAIRCARSAAAYAKWVPLRGWEPAPMLADYDLAVRDHEVNLASFGMAIVAVIELIVHKDDLFIETLTVAPGHQGLGQMLLARALHLGVPEL